MLRELSISLDLIALPQKQHPKCKYTHTRKPQDRRPVGHPDHGGKPLFRFDGVVIRTGNHNQG